MLDYLAVILVILIILHWIRCKPFFWNDTGIPYAVPLPIIGGAVDVFFKPFYSCFEELYNKAQNSPAYGFHLFNTPALIVNDPNLVKRITVNETNYFMSHGFHSNPDVDPMGKCIFFTTGEEWRLARSKMTPYFTPSRLKEMLPLVNLTADTLIEYISESSKKGPVDVQDASLKFTVDVIVRTVFGLQPDSFENPNSFFFGMQRELISFITSVKLMIGEMSPTLYSLLGLTSLSEGTTKKLTQLVKDVIDQRLKGIGNRTDFMQGMVELLQKEDLNNTKKKYNTDGTPVAKFDYYSIAGHCILMYLGGTETTGHTLSFLLYELALNTDIQDKAREEINKMAKRTNKKYNFEDLHELQYVHMLILETMRKYPIFTTFARKCTKEVNIDGINFSVGTKIMISPYAMHKNPKYFPNPEQFIPERFADVTKIIPGSYIPYGMGPRTCIGIKMAETEIALALCRLLPKFELSISIKTEIPLKMNRNITLSAKYGIWLDIKNILN